jgi:hypothetical protein
MRSGPVTVALTGVPSDLASVQVREPSGTVLTTLTQAPWTYEWSGTNDAVPPCFRATDRVGNVWAECTDYIVDDEDPVISRVDFGSAYGSSRLDTGGGWVGNVGGIGPTTEDESPIVRTELWVNGVAVTGNGQSAYWIAPATTAPTAELEVRVWDAAGNTSSKSFTVNIDKDAPAMTVYPAERALIRGEKFTTSFKATDPHGVAVTIPYPQDFPATGNETSVWMWAGKDGPKTITWQGIDKLGNYADVKRTVIIDNTAPTLTLKSAPKNKAKLTKTVSLTASASDRNGVAKVQMLVNGKLAATDTKAGYAFTLNPKKYGKTFTVQLRAYDKAGNVKYSTKRIYRR